MLWSQLVESLTVFEVPANQKSQSQVAVLAPIPPQQPLTDDVET